MLTTEAIRKRVKDVKAGLFSEHKFKSSAGRNWPEYEKKLSESIRAAFREIEPLIDEATKCIKTAKHRGSPHKLTLKQRVTLFPQMLSYARCGKNKSNFRPDNFCLEVHRVDCIRPTPWPLMLWKIPSCS